MNMTIISKRKRIEYTYTRHMFDRANEPGGWSFDVDEQGEPVLNTPLIMQGYLRCILGAEAAPALEDFIRGAPDLPHNRGLVTHTNSYMEPAKKRCSCGEVVRLERFTNTCQGCDADYNMHGQILAPREHWGEETGEHWSECY
jgi:hypothetical protein